MIYNSSNLKDGDDSYDRQKKMSCQTDLPLLLHIVPHLHLIHVPHLHILPHLHRIHSKTGKKTEFAGKVRKSRRKNISEEFCVKGALLFRNSDVSSLGHCKCKLLGQSFCGKFNNSLLFRMYAPPLQ